MGHGASRPRSASRSARALEHDDPSRELGAHAALLDPPSSASENPVPLGEAARCQFEFEPAKQVASQTEQGTQGTAAAPSSGGNWEDWDDDEDEGHGLRPLRLAQGVDGKPSLEAITIAGRACRTAVATCEGGRLCTIGGDGVAACFDTPLVCMHCSHCVYRFADARWTSDVDYFWFRNFAPDARLPEQEAHDLAKLAGRLQATQHFAAYACACSWQTVGDAKTLDPLGSPAAPEGGARLEDTGHQMVKWGKQSIAMGPAPLDGVEGGSVNVCT